MQWSFKFTKVCLLPYSLALYRVVFISDLSFVALQDVANRSFLKSHILYKTVDNRNLLAQKNAEIAKRRDQALTMRNQLYEANRKHMREIWELKQRVKGLEDE